MTPRITLVLLVTILMSQTAIGATEKSAANDSLVTLLPALTVSGEQAELPNPDKTRINTPAIKVQDPGSLADVAGLIPSARVSTNSRGDTHLMIRGAPERHVQTFLDGIPLNLAWDERVDLRTVPITGTGHIEGTRGLTTLLDGPGVLAGSVNIVAPTYDAQARRNRVGVVAGDFVHGRTNLQHNNRFGSWDFLGAAGWQGRDAMTLPKNTIERNNTSHRLNSDLSQYSALVRGSRPVADVGRLSVLGTYWSAEKGVPAELNKGADARFWRYPVRERALIGASLALPLNESGSWDLSTAMSADFFKQEIDPRGPDDWDTPQIAGQEYEKNWDRTGFGKARATHWLGETTQVSLQATGRYTHHREILTVGGPTDAYSQWLASLVAEAEFHPLDQWQLRLGAGVDHTSTPESGPQPANDAASHPAWNARVTRPLAGNAEVHVAASQRSRVPSLRELYSGALGRFVPNPELKAERQSLYEIGYSRVTSRVRLEAAAFLLYLDDGIEKVSLNNPENQFQRINQTSIRVPGLELSGSWRATNHFDLSLQHTILSARVQEAGEYNTPAEDRPDYLSRGGLTWRGPYHISSLIEAVVTGARWSSDSTVPSGLTRLPAGVIWNLRVAWDIMRSGHDIEIHARLDNVFDQRVDDQVGLPNAGQTISGGVAINF
ncbi:MAG: iron complex outermembrane receptor protein [Candidatus Krumholzibacteriia bacterium]|jgi:iron complex outermembrane receptor protein